MSRWSGMFHIVDTITMRSLESWPTQSQAQYFCDAVNEHEQRNGRPRSYVVEAHPIEWRKKY